MKWSHFSSFSFMLGWVTRHDLLFLHKANASRSLGSMSRGCVEGSILSPNNNSATDLMDTKDEKG